MGTWGVVLMKNLKVFLVLSSRELGGQSVCKAASKPFVVCSYRDGLTQNENYYDQVQPPVSTLCPPNITTHDQISQAFPSLFAYCKWSKARGGNELVKIFVKILLQHVNKVELFYQESHQILWSSRTVFATVMTAAIWKYYSQQNPAMAAQPLGGLSEPMMQIKFHDIWQRFLTVASIDPTTHFDVDSLQLLLLGGWFTAATTVRWWVESLVCLCLSCSALYL